MKRLKPKKEDIFKLTAIVLAALLCVTSSGVDSKAEGETNDYGLRNPRVAFQTRETVYFGNYWQEDTNGDGWANKNDKKTPIRWQILKKYDDGTALVVADKILDNKQYKNGVQKSRINEITGEIEYYWDWTCTWETSSVREWLNGNNDNDFLREAFSDEEQNAILLEDISNRQNPIYKTDGGNNTSDKVFLLSIDDMKNEEYGFTSDYNNDTESRVAKMTDYARYPIEYIIPYDYTNSYWLRTPGSKADKGSVISTVGSIEDDNLTYKEEKGIRPALRLNLFSSFVRQGETIAISVKGSEWDSVVFGKYEGRNIVWRVLNVNGNDAFVLADSLIKNSNYYGDHCPITWKESNIRRWLNNDFFDSSFNESEKSMMKSTLLKNYDNPFFNTEGGENTYDKIFILSLGDVVNQAYGFSNMYNVITSTRKTNASWWLRSPGEYSNTAIVVNNDGFISYYDSSKVDLVMGIRPCLHIDLSSSAWKKGEPVKAGDPTGGVEVPIDPNSRNDFPIDNPKKDTTETNKTTESTNPEQPVDSKPTSQDIYRNAGAGVGKISSDGRTLIDTDGKKWFMSSKLTNKDLKKNLAVAVKNGGKYKITKITKKGSKVTGGTVTYMAPYDKNATSMTAPKSVKFGGATFTVTAIGANAFKNNKKLKTATIEGNVTAIGANAFSGCKSLTKVTIKKGSLTSIGIKAFYDCKKLNSFSISGLKLKKVGSNAFKNTNSKITFKCPKSKLKDYEKLFKKAGASKKAKYTK